ncbi:MAG: Phenylalanine-tRNA ligase beta subunit [Candidatus Daviesbacteria bacterium GW2011_GWA1_41_61]|uniref:Phenylalanine--tRNA ligase beta subunit n=1 Tax=Candidatus Daviesbacteria bacterium GW2011_GWA2_40_9 TaxID=1618424 RepID=A0A0G0U968_9BACT|nr:MAG: Phenylalanine-tRNA ligase beta subunit [Candidatus Daviesbacteria bacterium GW2011_GWA2_40_9]KKR93415.1 MAG: Phenylalanine-tRNA ligase beta subunit [Candidatus Daviesbacteria bacterium GW2011_GWB1_41_15]KKS15036.1 MAG: Phenylalanine-tRNA ligase beta subunit [Candidatus Daviesbacteria bacterium GW2011_GWA1_41_61]
MKVSIGWLRELVKLNTSIEKTISSVDLKTIGVKEVTENFFELDMKGYNRADLLSLRGVAYEVAAITDSEVTFKEPQDSEFSWVKQKLPETPVKVETEENCPLYCIAKIEGLKVGHSSPNWVKKLADSGMRSVNNVADVTNLVMLEYGQPTHAFDAERVKDQTLIVRMADTGEELITLDNKKRILEPTDMVIADPQKSVGLAGVMGGKDSEISDNTTTILLEAAIFNPTTIRRTAGRFNLPSEASKRFQHGLTKVRLLQAVEAAIKMYKNLGGKLTAITIIDHSQEQAKEIEVSHQKLNSLIGVDIKPDFVQSSLEKLHFQVEKVGESWKVTPPYWRQDVEIEADVIEEAARMYGYENIPPKKLTGELPQKIDQGLFEFISKLKQTLVDTGLDEIQTYSFFSTQVLKNFEVPKERLLKVANPMSAETEYLRVRIAPNLVEKVAENLKAFKEVGVFEVGKVYLPMESGPSEKYVLSITLVDETTNPLRKLFSIWQKVSADLGLKVTVEEGEQDAREKVVFHPTRFIKLMVNGQDVGRLGEIHPRIINRFGVEKRVAMLEIALEQL